ncbi:SAV_2336 N-terminal domain-related protein [Streptomyces sp. NPDC001118]
MPEPLGRALDALIACLDQDVDARTLADALWLAAASSSSADPTARADQRPDAREGTAQVADAPTKPEPEPQGAGPSTRPSGPATKRVRSYPLYEEFEDISTPLSGPSVSVAAGRALSQTVELGRSLRPFMRRYPRGRQTGLDMQATIDSYARGGELMPVLAPLPEPWFDVVVVTDTHLTTEVWHGAIEEFINLLGNTGAFRHVRRWHLTTDGHDPYVTDARGHFVNAVHAAGPENRRLFLIMSDCTAPAWYESAVWQLLRQWAMRAPLSIANPLPSRLWHRTALDLPAVHVRNRIPGSSNAALRVKLPPHLKWVVNLREPYMAIPTLTLTAHSLQRWAHGFVRGAPEGYEAVLVGPYGHATSPFLRFSRDMTEAESAEAAENAVQAFMNTAEPAAVRLAALCSPFRRLSLPLLQLIRQEVIRDATNSDVAELLTSSLLNVDTSGTGPPVITFTDQARARLTCLVSRHDAWRTYETLSRYIAQRTRLPAQSLDAIAAFPADRLPEELQPFAHASQELLKALRKGAANLHMTHQAIGADRPQEQHVQHREAYSEAFSEEAFPESPSLRDPLVEQEFGRLRGELWEEALTDQFGAHSRQAADQVLRAFLYFLTDCLTSPEGELRSTELHTFTAHLARFAELCGVVVEAGTDPAFMLRASAPGIDDSVTVLGEIFTFGSQFSRPQSSTDAAPDARAGLRVAPFAILITFLEGGGHGGPDVLGNCVAVARSRTAKVVVLRFPTWLSSPS